MTFVATMTAISQRFLTERSFDLIVAPALADFEYDTDRVTGPRRFARHTAVLTAFAGAFWDDAIRGGDVATFTGLALIPACYYTFFFLLGLPGGLGRMSSSLIAGLAIAVLTLSLGPVLVCYWPERQPPKPSTEP